MRPSELAYVAEKITCCGLNNIATVFGCTQSEYDSSFEEYDDEKLVNKFQKEDSTVRMKCLLQKWYTEGGSLTKLENALLAMDRKDLISSK